MSLPCSNVSGDGWRKVGAVLAAGLTTAALRCGSPTETDHLIAQIRQAHHELMSTSAREVSIAERVPTERSYVLVFLPADAVDSHLVRTSDLPAEAKEAIQRQVEHRDFKGALIGFVQTDRSVWQTLPEGVNATGLLYAWKQGGESVSVRMTKTSGGATIVAIR